MFNKDELRLLNSQKGLKYLLRADKLDFKETIKQLTYEEALTEMQIQMIEIQKRVVAQKERIIILVEGREFAGKGGAIHVFTEHLNPRTIRKIALPKPNEIERSQWYFKRYVEQLPVPGEMVFFDRSWYNRAMVEPVNDFCTLEEYERFISEVNNFEQMISGAGVQIIKLFLSISKKEQEKRIELIRNNPLRSWELSAVDKSAVRLWDKYSAYEKKMFKKTNTKANPWFIFRSNDKRIARLQSFKKILEILDPPGK